MPERTRREIDNQMGNINEHSEELNDDQEIIDYTIDEYTNRPIYQKKYHPQDAYAFNEEYEREKHPWGSAPGMFKEFRKDSYRPEEYRQDVYRQEEYRPEGYMRDNWRQWDERPEGGDPQWIKKEKKAKKEEASTRKKSKFRVCTNCGTTTTPAWRRSTNNKILLCNACGLYQRLHGSDRPFSVMPDGKTKAIKNNIEKGVCRGCGVSQAPLWKRGHNNEWLCSSCGLLYNRRERPEEYSQEWPEYSQDEPWKYNEEYQEYPEWHQKERDQAMQYHYEEKDAEAYFADNRFREYSNYYGQEKRR
ncbi:uncharacterized protein NEMAJ01_0912 [Nematocida major]|uniref:uncharacterized protein n=1 Tax=Nematocida major TaxID=1912982 RepID=UPI0020077F6F|nr:uncharacterized protein NEMAJ01_0912 [Nematocida major]KAH9386016.1 hypothetical protein NEMAJ01_0912 [Nematocida major]